MSNLLLYMATKQIKDHQTWLDSVDATRGDNQRRLGREESQEGERDLQGFGRAEVEKSCSSEDLAHMESTRREGQVSL